MKITRFVSSQEELTFPWGIAYRDFLKDGKVLAIVPLNWIIRGVRNLWFVLRVPKHRSIEEHINYHLKLAVDRIINYEWDHPDASPLSPPERAVLGITKMELRERIEDLVYKGWDR